MKVSYFADTDTLYIELKALVWLKPGIWMKTHTGCGCPGKHCFHYHGACQQKDRCSEYHALGNCSLSSSFLHKFILDPK